ncbi:hypothetical protein B0H14DRAFT_3166859 [Mycena olivaceomarginata]|nr:hypothetical protein B0H14DRAFT_3166859 [Mycena olivaceomarginata]
MSCPSFELDTLGVILVGTLVSYVLLGVVTMQVYDSVQMKSMVGAVWCGEVGNAISFGMAVYTIIITNLGHPERLAHPPKSFMAAVFLGSLVSFSGVCGSRASAGRCRCSVSCPQCHYVRIRYRRALSRAGAELGPLFIAIWAASAANDLLIAGTLVYLLYRLRPNTFERTTAVVEKLIRWTIETGVVTSIASVIMLSVFVSMGTNSVGWPSSSLFPIFSPTPFWQGE